jgi:hypothetical protein
MEGIRRPKRTNCPPYARSIVVWCAGSLLRGTENVSWSIETDLRHIPQGPRQGARAVLTSRTTSPWSPPHDTSNQGHTTKARSMQPTAPPQDEQPAPRFHRKRQPPVRSSAVHNRGRIDSHQGRLDPVCNNRNQPFLCRIGSHPPPTTMKKRRERREGGREIGGAGSRLWLQHKSPPLSEVAVTAIEARVCMAVGGGGYHSSDHLGRRREGS